MDTHIAPEPKSSGMNTTVLAAYVKAAMAEAIADGSTPGGVVYVIRNGQTALLDAYGHRSVEPTTETATLETIYDLASLTKPIATASSIMKLVEQGKIRLTDSVETHIADFKNTEEEQNKKEFLLQLERSVDQGKVKPGLGHWETADDETADLLAKTLTAIPTIESPSAIKQSFNLLPRDRESITIGHLLTHTSALPSFLRYYERYPEKGARDKIIKDIATEELRGPVGGQFIYSDLGYIVLGEVVERVSGKSLAEFSQEEIFKPLGMADTMFTPPESLRSRIAPTEWRAEGSAVTGDATRTIIRGEVHDGNAWVQDGVSGHAGLFSTASDLGRYFTMLLNGGELDGTRIFSPLTVESMVQNHANLGINGPARGYGWDLTSTFSTQKGDIFTSGYGHTGFTGTSVWIVPEEKLAIIILTNRVHPDGKGNVVPLRAKIANIVAGCITESYNEPALEKK